MNTSSRVLSLVVAGASVAVLSGCSMDLVLWGPDGARVIDTTEQLIDGASTGEQSTFACDDFSAGFGVPNDWNGLSAGEPEAFDGDISVDRPSLDAAWRINLEGRPNGPAPDEAVPTDVFFREADDGLCVADIIWQTVQG